jgi:hypothetical protein
MAAVKSSREAMTIFRIGRSLSFFF